MSRPDRPTSAFSVGVRPAVAPSVPAPPDTPTLNALVGPTQFTRPHRTRQDGPVCVVSGVCRYEVDDCSERVVGNPIHAAEADATQTKQFCRVWRGGVN